MANPSPYHDTTLECQVLASVMLDKAILADAVGAGLGPEVFHGPHHGIIAQTILGLYDSGRSADRVSVAAELSGPTLDTLWAIEDVATTPRVTDWVMRLVEYNKRRQLRRATKRIMSMLDDGENATQAACEAAEAEIMAVTTQRQGGELKLIGEGLNGLSEQIAKYSSGNTGGLSTGLQNLDSKTGGFFPGDYIILAGRPSMGKTALALTIAANVAKNGLGVPVFSLEMSRPSLIERVICMEAHLSMHRLRTGTLPQRDYPRLDEAMQQYQAAPLYIDDTPSITTAYIRSRLMRIQNCALVVVDYLQLIDGPGESRQQEITGISRRMKGLAKEFNVPFLVLSQLNRKVEDRQDKRPGLADIRESGAIEQDADTVLGAYRGAYYYPSDESVAGIAEIAILKQRNGPTGVCKLAFLNECARFENLAEEHVDRAWWDD